MQHYLASPIEMSTTAAHAYIWKKISYVYYRQELKIYSLWNQIKLSKTTMSPSAAAKNS